MSNEIVALWERIDAMLQREGCQVRGRLRGPATARELALLRETLLVQVPDELIRSLSVHDGEIESSPMEPVLQVGRLFSSREIRIEYSQQLYTEAEQPFGPDLADEEIPDLIGDEIIRVAGAVRPRRYPGKSWIPIASSNGDVKLYCDMDPAPGGSIGQIISVDLELCVWSVVADGFFEMLSTLLPHSLRYRS